MADISKIQVGSTEYNIKDASARSSISTLSSTKANLTDLQALQTLLFSFMPEGYSADTSYSVGDVCVYDNKLYQCTSPTTGTWDNTKWAQVRLGNVSALHYSEVE